MTLDNAPVTPLQQRSFGWGKMLLLLLVVIVLTVFATVWVMTRYIFPRQFEPVQLSTSEVQTLNAKLARLDPLKPSTPDTVTASSQDGEALTPEPYSEEGAQREIIFTERELNGLLAKNTDLADKLVIDLSQDMASAKLLVPLDPDFPFLGGKTLKVSAGVELRYSGQNPVVSLRGISLWGVPIPNAWMGNIKNIDLVGEFGAGQGFWQAFAEGVEDIRVEEGRLKITLKE